MITYKNKPETDKDFKHVDVYIDNKYVGYILDDKLVYPNAYNPKKRWGMILAGDKFTRAFSAPSKKKLISMLESKNG